MGKKNNSAAKSAAEQVAAEQTAPAEVNVIQLGDFEKMMGARTIGALDANRTADVLTGMRSMFFENKSAANDFNMPEDSVKELNRITAIGYVALFTTSVVMDQTPFAVAMRKNQLEAILEVAPKLGVKINTKLLPAPDKNGNVTLPSNAVEPSKETKQQIKDEQKATAKKSITNPAEIETEDQLKESLLSILVKGAGSENVYDKIATAINFYESYLSIKANKSENREAELAAIKERTRADLLSDIAHLLGKCTFTLSGVAKFMYEQTERTKSPVVAFCILRDASLNRKTGMPQIDDQLVADIVKVLVRWYADTEIQVSKEVIAGFERDIELLKKDAKKNAKGIEDGKKKIENANKHIEAVENVVTYVNAPERDVIDNFPANYSDSNAEGYKMARMIGSKIMKSYYGDTNAKTVKQESLLHNLQQYMGVITNMFLPPTSVMVDYSEANITELEKAEEKAEGESEKN